MPNGETALCDTGPLVALCDKASTAHGICREALQGHSGRLLTTWAVLTEAMHLVKHPANREVLWDFISRDGVELASEDRNDLPRINWYMTKYSDLPMDFADATLVVVGERLHIRVVFTLDHDFHVYRPRHTRHFEVFP